MAKATGRTVIVQNIAGARGTIAAQKVLDGTPDGSWCWSEGLSRSQVGGNVPRGALGA